LIIMGIKNKRLSKILWRCLTLKKIT